MKRPAFTLVELLVVIAIIGLLSSVAVVSLGSARSKARDAKRTADLRQISQAIELFADVNNRLPMNIGNYVRISSVTGATFITDISPYLARVPQDPQNGGQVGDYGYGNIDGNKYYVCGVMEHATGQGDVVIGDTTYNYCLTPNGT